MRLFLSLFSVLFLFSSLEARDLTNRFGAGFEQVYTNGFVLDEGDAQTEAQQLNGLAVNYGVFPQFQAGAFFGFTRDFESFMIGPTLRYDFQTHLYRDQGFWNHLNLFIQSGLFLKEGSDVKTGLNWQVANLGFEIFPFSALDFAILSSAGVVVDIVEESDIGFTNSMFGNVGLRFYY